MKTEAAIRAELVRLRKDRKNTKRRFDRYDNHEDMQSLAELAARIAGLEWVLSPAPGVSFIDTREYITIGGMEVLL